MAERTPEEKKAIVAWFEDRTSDECFDNVDNERIALVGDEEEEAKYARQLDEGCCGFFDSEIEVNGRRFKVGFNYGH